MPDVAIGADQGGRYLLVLNADNVVEQRKIEAGQHVGPLRVIEQGLKPDDRVVVDGIAARDSRPEGRSEACRRSRSAAAT